MADFDDIVEIEEIQVRADGSVRTGRIEREFYCHTCTMTLPEMARQPGTSHCTTCEQEYF